MGKPALSRIRQSSVRLASGKKRSIWVLAQRTKPNFLQEDFWPLDFGALASRGAYTPVLAKHSKHFSLEDSLAIGVDRMQRNFGPLKQQVDEWRRCSCQRLRQSC